MNTLFDINGNPIRPEAVSIWIPSLGINLQEAFDLSLFPAPTIVTQQIAELENKVATAVGTISSVTVDIATDESGEMHAEGNYDDGVLAITLYNIKGEKGDTFTFDDLTEEQKASLKGDKGEKMTFADLTDEEKQELKGDKGDKLTFADLTDEDKAELKGDKGDPLRYEELTSEQKAELKGEPGTPGAPGKDGNIDNLKDTLSGNETNAAPSIRAVNEALKNIKPSSDVNIDTTIPATPSNDHVPSTALLKAELDKKANAGSGGQAIADADDVYYNNTKTYRDGSVGKKLTELDKLVGPDEKSRWNTAASNVELLMAKTFPLTVGYFSKNNGTFEYGTSVAPSVAWTATRQGNNVAPSDVVVTSDLEGTLADNKLSYSKGSFNLITSKSFKATVTEGGQSVNLAEIKWIPSFYRYYGTVASEPTEDNIASVIKSLGKALSIEKTLGDKNNPISLAAGKYYIFAVKSDSAINWVINNATGGTISGAKTGSVTLEQENKYQINIYQYIVIPASEANWAFFLTLNP